MVCFVVFVKPYRVDSVIKAAFNVGCEAVADEDNFLFVGRADFFETIIEESCRGFCDFDILGNENIREIRVEVTDF